MSNDVAMQSSQSAAALAAQRGGLSKPGQHLTMSKRLEQNAIATPAFGASAGMQAVGMASTFAVGMTMGGPSSSAGFASRASRLVLPAIDKIGARASGKIGLPVLAGAMMSMSGSVGGAMLGAGLASAVLASLGKAVPGAGGLAKMAAAVMPKAPR